MGKEKKSQDNCIDGFVSILHVFFLLLKHLKPQIILLCAEGRQSSFSSRMWNNSSGVFWEPGVNQCVYEVSRLQTNTPCCRSRWQRRHSLELDWVHILSHNFAITLLFFFFSDQTPYFKGFKACHILSRWWNDHEAPWKWHLADGPCSSLALPSSCTTFLW